MDGRTCSTMTGCRFSRILRSGEGSLQSYHDDLLGKVARYGAYYFHRSLRAHPPRLRALMDYGLDNSSISTFQIGYATHDWRSLTKTLESRREYVMDSARTIGLVTRGSRGLRDQFRNRYVLPIHSDSGSVVGFTSILARWLNRDYKPKSMDVIRMNSCHSPIFDKRNYLLGGHCLVGDSLNESPVYVSDDPFETLWFHARGIPNVVTPLIDGAFRSAAQGSQTRRIYCKASEIKRIQSRGNARIDTTTETTDR